MNAWRIHENRLRIRGGEDRKLSYTGRLWLRRDGEDFLRKDRIEKRRFSNVRSTRDGYEAGAMLDFHRPIVRPWPRAVKPIRESALRAIIPGHLQG